MFNRPGFHCLVGMGLHGEARAHREVAAPPVPPRLKIVSILARKQGMTHDAFTRHWIEIHGKMARELAGVKGFVGSEPVAAPGTDAAALLFGNFDGIASIWFADRAGAAATVGSEQGRAWLADGDSFIDREGARNFFTREHVILGAARANGAIKRTVLIVRQPNLTRAQFLQHWLGRHADLARGVPGLAGSVFSEVDSVAGGRVGEAPEIDGIAESWWTGPGTENGGKIASAAAAAWAEDGKQLHRQCAVPHCYHPRACRHLVISPSA